MSSFGVKNDPLSNLPKRALVISEKNFFFRQTLQNASFSGGETFGYAVDTEEKDKLATTLLCVMVKCLFTGERFLVRLLPCHALKADFLFKVLCNTIIGIHGSGGNVVGVICDNNRVNQRCYGMFTPKSTDTKWIVESPAISSKNLFLIYDPVHLLKNIRNNWMTEMTKTLSFQHPVPEKGKVFACWGHLQEFYKREADTTLTHMSKLTQAALTPSNLEKQKVSLVLQVFCDATSSALKTSSNSTDSWKNTAEFIDIVVQLWKVLNCKNKFQATRFKDPDRAVVDLGENNRAREVLSMWADLAEDMTVEKGAGCREHKLTSDTGQALRWTCKCLLDLSHELLTTQESHKHDFVPLGFFQQDDLEKHFGHFRMSAGCNYYISVADVLNTHNKDKAQLMLRHCTELDNEIGLHMCSLCNKDVTVEEAAAIDSFPSFIDAIDKDEKMSLFNIGGYIAAKHSRLKGNKADPAFEDVRDFVATLDRDGLAYPNPEFFSLILYAFLFFTKTNERLCRNRFVKVVQTFPVLFHLELNVEKAALMRLSNIFMKRFAEINAGTRKGQKRKIEKLSSCSR